jgi:hypothetical protein
MSKHSFRAVVSALVLSATVVLPAYAAGPQNGTCKANFPDYGAAWLTFKDGKPVSYRTNSYQAHSVSRSGNTIKIDQARFSVTSENASSVTGNWRLGSYKATGIKFACK